MACQKTKNYAFRNLDKTQTQQTFALQTFFKTELLSYTQMLLAENESLMRLFCKNSITSHVARKSYEDNYFLQ